MRTCALFLVLVGNHALAQQTINEARFNEVVAKLENDVIEFARQVEGLYATRCEEIQLHQCSRSHYDECSSLYPNQECLEGESYNIPACGDLSSGCSGLYDFSISTVRIPVEIANGENGNPTDPQVIETVCYTSAMEQWLQSKRATDASFWNGLGVEPRAWYFGSTTGFFRIWPARHSRSCGEFDPRIRPWYVAASSGPKNVIMVLDTSGSMSGIRIKLLKQAASRVVNTLTVGDRVAIVPFSGTASRITDANGRMFVATDENKNILSNAIDQLEAVGATNFYDALTTAFDILDASAKEEIAVNCNTAILFFTDGEMTEPAQITDQDVLDLVSARISRSNQVLSQPILMFTYSVSELEDVHELPSKLACSTDLGVWSKVTTDASIVDSLSSYYLLFALGLGADQNEDFVAWVEPYEFATGNTLGTSVSVPVYDRSKSPPLFLGVVAVDLSLAALDAALGISGADSGSQQSIERVALAAVARCPVLDLETCELESFRRQGAAGDQALCTTNCSEVDFVQVESDECATVSDYPTELFVSPTLLDESYEERVCCKIGETAPSNECRAVNEDGRLSIAVIVGASVGAFLALGLVGYVCIRRGALTSRVSSKLEQVNAQTGADKFHSRLTESEPEYSSGATGTTSNFEVMRPPPTAPHFPDYLSHAK